MQDSFVYCFGYDIISFCQTWPTDAEITKADEDQKQKKIRKIKLPSGTSEYQVCICFFMRSMYLCSRFTYFWLFFDRPYVFIILIFFYISAYQESSVEIIGICFYYYFQAAWFNDEPDEEESDCDNEDDGMLLDEIEDEFPGQEGNMYLDADGDEASQRFGDSDEETDNDSVMMVSLLITCKLQY